MTVIKSTGRAGFSVRSASRSTGVFACLFLTLGAYALGRAPEVALAAGKPNIVVLQTDDQTASLLHARFVDRKGKHRSVMPNTLKYVVNQGVEFNNYYANDPLCSASRSAFLSGQYAHTNGVVRNSGIRGGANGIFRSKVMDSSFVVALNRAGYHTAHYGDFINHYGDKSGYADPAVPKGWDDWVTDWSSHGVRRYYGYYLNVNGHIRGPFGKVHYRKYRNKDPKRCPHGGKTRCNYHTDLITKKAVRAIRSMKRGPFYMQVDYEAPHDGTNGPPTAEPPTRYIGTARKTPFRRPPGFDEKNIKDKPRLIRKTAKRLTNKELEGLKVRYRKQLEALRGVDDSVGRIVRTLKAEHKLGNTYIFYMSDNGYFLGEHRYSKSKFLAYEPSVRVPMVVRGPIAKKGKQSEAIVANIDLAETITQLAHVKPLLPTDGRSFKPLLRKPGHTGRRAILLESYLYPSEALDRHFLDIRPYSDRRADRGLAQAANSAPPLNYSAIRVGGYKFIKYADGGQELYDLRVDPYEQSNKVHIKRYRKVYEYLAEKLAQRRFCEGDECRKGVKHVPHVKPAKHHKKKHTKHHKHHKHQGTGGAKS